MSRAQSQYLRIFDATGTTRHRWQSYYAYRPAQWAGETWDYQAFVADGFTAGVSGDETNVSVSAPATPMVSESFERAILNGEFVEMLLYEFNAGSGNLNPQSGQTLIGSYTGQAVGGTATATTITMQLGTALSPVGAQFPPRKLTTAIMGQGCVL
jgi:hypothetical protein